MISAASRFLICGTLLSVVAACAPSTIDRPTPFTLAERPDYPGYGEGIAAQDIEWDAKSLAADFGELVFQNESGYVHRRLLRWEKPITIAINDPVVRTHRETLDDLMARIKAVAPNLRATVTNAPVGDITIRTAPKSEMKEIAPTALCFFVPVRANWEEFVSLREDGGGSWANMKDLESITIFIPANAPPHVYRACIIEEITQALGPRNDIYGLEDSIYNDDNIHTWPTAFDLLMIAVLYDEDLKPRVPRAEAERVAKAAFASGRYGKIGTRSRERQSFENRYLAFLDEFNAETKTEKKYAVALKIRDLTRTFDAQDHRRAEAERRAGFVQYNAGEYRKAVTHFRAAVKAIRAALDESSPRFASVTYSLGIALMRQASWEEADKAFGSAAPVMAAYGMDRELADILHFKSISEFELGKTEAARETARASLKWVKYVYGADNERVETRRKLLIDNGPLS